MACCPSVYYCVDGVATAVEVDEDGHYTPPDGWTAGPFATLAEALESCPMQFSCEYEADIDTLDIPGTFTLRHTNSTGIVSDGDVSAVACPDNGTGLLYTQNNLVGGVCTSCAAGCLGVLEVTIGCIPEPDPPDERFAIIITACCMACAVGPGSAITDPGPGWVVAGPTTVYRVFTAAEWNADPWFPGHVAHFSWTDYCSPGNDGEWDLELA